MAFVQAVSRLPPPLAGEGRGGGANPIRRLRHRDNLPAVISGLIRKSVRDPKLLRYQLLKNLWIEIKRFSSPNIVNVELAAVLDIDRALITGRVSRHCPLILAALCQTRGYRRAFEVGTYLGETTWLLAHNNPELRVFTLDLPDLETAGALQLERTDAEYFTHWDRGRRFAGTPEQDRITQLFGDSATFDFSPYAGTMDLVYIDASHSYSYVKSDSEAALAMLSPQGMIVWDDYTYYPGIFAYLNELAPQLKRPIMHILGTRLAIYDTAPTLPSPASGGG